IIDLFRRGTNLFGRTRVVTVGCADQREILLVRYREEYPPVTILEDVAAIVIVEFADHDMRALDEPRLALGRHVRDLGNDLADPRAAGVDQGTRGDLLPRAGLG